MIKYRFENDNKTIDCDYWNLKTLKLNVDSFNAEIILTDMDGQRYSHTFMDVNYVMSKTWQDAIDECGILISEYAI